MTQEKIFQILETKKYPLKNFWEYFSHYLLAVVAFILFCLTLYFYFDSKNIIFITLLGIPLIFCSLFIFFYLGPKHLRLTQINIQFPNNEIAYHKVKEVLAFYKWRIIEENGTNYIQALRHYGYSINKNQGRAISLFFSNGNIYAISLYYPETRSDFFGMQRRNIKLIEWKLIEFNKRENS